jgi:hypothetical protein
MRDMPPVKKPSKRVGASAPLKVKVNVRRAVTDFLNFTNMAAQFGAQADEVKLLLRDKVLPTEGMTDENGHSWMQIDGDPIEDPSGKGAVTGIKRERRAPKKLNPERAEQFLRRKKLWDSCTEQVTVINEDAILAAAFAKTISGDELEALYDVNETFAFIPVRVK